MWQAEYIQGRPPRVYALPEGAPGLNGHSHTACESEEDAIRAVLEVAAERIYELRRRIDEALDFEALAVALHQRYRAGSLVLSTPAIETSIAPPDEQLW